MEVADSPLHNSLRNGRYLLLGNIRSATIASYSLGCFAGRGQVTKLAVETVEIEIKPNGVSLRDALVLFDLRTQSCGEARLGVTQVVFRDGTIWKAA